MSYMLGECMIYKASMFNHLCMIDGEMVLYNSLTGSKGIRKVRKEDVEIVSEILGKKEIPDSDLTMFHKLIDLDLWLTRILMKL